MGRMHFLQALFLAWSSRVSSDREADVQKAIDLRISLLQKRVLTHWKMFRAVFEQNAHQIKRAEDFYLKRSKCAFLRGIANLRLRK